MHPLARLPAGVERPLFLCALAVSLAAMAAMAVVGRPLETTAAPHGIGSYEFAGDAAAARQLLASWDAAAKIRAGFSLGIDYLFLVGYSTLIAMACLWAVQGFRGRLVRRLGVFLAWGQWMAGTFDALENAILLAMLLGAPADPWPALARLCAVLKFTLVGSGLLYSAAGAAVRLLSCFRPKQGGEVGQVGELEW